MLSKDEYEKALEKISPVMDRLQMPFDPDELSAITGSKLVDIESQAVLDRLNAAFGPMGLGWTIDGEWMEMPDASPRKRTGGRPQEEDPEGLEASEIFYRGVMFLGKLKYRIPGTNEWSEPILAVGGDIDKNAGRNLYDMYKGALTNAIGQAASKLGVGGEVYRNKVTTTRNGEIKIEATSPEIIEKFRMFLGEPVAAELAKFFNIPTMTEKTIRAFGAILKLEREGWARKMAELEKEYAGNSQESDNK